MVSKCYQLTEKYFINLNWILTENPMLLTFSPNQQINAKYSTFIHRKCSFSAKLESCGNMFLDLFVKHCKYFYCQKVLVLHKYLILFAIQQQIGQYYTKFTIYVFSTIQIQNGWLKKCKSLQCSMKVLVVHILV